MRDDRETAEETEITESADSGGAPAGAYFGTTREILERYSHCALCGGRLHFSYLADFGKGLTHEMAKCPECGTQAHNLLHRLQ